MESKSIDKICPYCFFNINLWEVKLLSFYICINDTKECWNNKPKRSLLASRPIKILTIKGVLEKLEDVTSSGFFIE